MEWVRQHPRSIVPIAEAPALFATRAPRILSAAYAGLLQENGGDIPRKTGLDIFKFAAALPNVALFAFTMPDQCIYRIVGEAWKQRIGLNPIGKNYLDFVAQKRRDTAVASLQNVVGIPSAFRVIIEQTYSAGRTAHLEVFAAPLRSDEKGVDGFAIFAAQPIAPIHFGREDDRIVLGANIVERNLIDIGFGVDETFSDVVRPQASGPPETGPT